MKKIKIYTKEKIYNFTSDNDKNYYYAIMHAHRENGPAIIWYDNNNISYKAWCLNGKYHRKNRPAVIWYYENDNIKLKSYYLNGKRHNENGPTIIKYFKNGNIDYKKYYLYNEYYSETKFIQTMLIKKLELI